MGALDGLVLLLLAYFLLKSELASYSVGLTGMCQPWSISGFYIVCPAQGCRLHMGELAVVLDVLACLSELEAHHLLRSGPVMCHHRPPDQLCLVLI